MLISVIVPVYNVEKYLRQCLDSLFAQTYDNIEVIMVDDGSTDTSGIICDEYDSKYKNFKVIHKKNAGLGMARNTGIENITGDLVTFVDSDDYLDNDCIMRLYNELVLNNVDMCKGGFKRVLDTGVVVLERKYKNEVFKGEKARLEFLPRMIGSSPSKRDSVEMCVCGSIYKTELIKKYSLKFPSERELISEDLVFNIDYMQHANGACIIEEMGYNYRVNLNSLTSSYRSDRFEACKHFYLELKKRLQGLGYGRQTIFRLDRMFFIYVKMSIGQEKISVSNHSICEAYKMISKICNDQLLNEIIDNYPVQELGFKQYIFLFLIKHKMIRSLLILSRTGRL